MSSFRQSFYCYSFHESNIQRGKKHFSILDITLNRLLLIPQVFWPCRSEDNIWYEVYSKYSNSPDEVHKHHPLCSCLQAPAAHDTWWNWQPSTKIILSLSIHHKPWARKGMKAKESSPMRPTWSVFQAWNRLSKGYSTNTWGATYEVQRLLGVTTCFLMQSPTIWISLTSCRQVLTQKVSCGSLLQPAACHVGPRSSRGGRAPDDGGS